MVFNGTGVLFLRLCDTQPGARNPLGGNALDQFLLQHFQAWIDNTPIPDGHRYRWTLLTGRQRPILDVEEYHLLPATAEKGPSLESREVERDMLDVMTSTIFPTEHPLLFVALVGTVHNRAFKQILEKETATSQSTSGWVAQMLDNALSSEGTLKSGSDEIQTWPAIAHEMANRIHFLRLVPPSTRVRAVARSPAPHYAFGGDNGFERILRSSVGFGTDPPWLFVDLYDGAEQEEFHWALTMGQVELQNGKRLKRFHYCPRRTPNSNGSLDWALVQDDIPTHAQFFVPGNPAPVWQTLVRVKIARVTDHAAIHSALQVASNSLQIVPTSSMEYAKRAFTKLRSECASSCQWMQGDYATWPNVEKDVQRTLADYRERNLALRPNWTVATRSFRSKTFHDDIFQ